MSLPLPKRAPASVLVRSTETVQRVPIDGQGAYFETVEVVKQTAVGRPGAAAGVATETFMVPYQHQTLRWVAGAPVTADAALHEFLTRNNCPVDWSPA